MALNDFNFTVVPTEIICGDPGVPVNGYKANVKQVYHLNDTVSFHCNEGYTMDGSILNVCTQSGEWAHPVPVCGGKYIGGCFTNLSLI